MKIITLIDCYTDEPSGLGVPPYLGTYPRYIAGYYISKGYTVKYMTVDDLRVLYFKPSKTKKTDIMQYNRTINQEAEGELIAIVGIHTPGKYLSAVPGTLRELGKIDLKLKVAGPAIHGTQLQGGRRAENSEGIEFLDFNFNYDDIKRFAVRGASIIKQIPDERIVEIETARGCLSGKCSFCLEPIKSNFCVRKKEDIIEEIAEFYKLGVRHFRIGKQSDFYAIDEPEWLLREIRNRFPEIKVLHIDNVNPNSVVSDKNALITKAVIKYCTPGNIAAFGVETFDEDVIKVNSLNSNPNTVKNAIEILNKFGGDVGENGMPKFLPGINVILGLPGETKKTLEDNLNFLKDVYDNGLKLRRINIRQLSVFPNTPISKLKLPRNKKFYYSFREKIRNNIDFPMLQRVFPVGTVLEDVKMEIYDGNNTFGRQIGTYPIIVGVKEKLELKRYYNIKITSHMLRSLTGVVC